MKAFLKQQDQLTLPVLMYIIASFIVVFINNVHILLFLFILFVALTYILNQVFKTLYWILGMTFLVISIYFLITSLLSWQLSINILRDIIPKGISLSIVVCTGIVVFNGIPTIQLVKIAKLILLWENAIFAILSGFRIVPVLLNASDKIIVAQRVRGIHRNIILSVYTFLMNLLICFFEFVFDFYNQLNVLNFKNVNNIKLFKISFYNIAFLLYLSIAIGGVFYGAK